MMLETGRMLVLLWQAGLVPRLGVGKSAVGWVVGSEKMLQRCRAPQTLTTQTLTLHPKPQPSKP